MAEINGKMLIYIVIIAVIVLLLLVSFGIIKIGNAKIVNVANSVSNSNIPEKCRIQQGYTEQSWKEHLGHHAETRDCLQYFP
ncbi:hypothetical protein J4466_04530 [Candidatus Pacearchaeota archaeon]|nr:hypothetical protein [Candidatus Pacearchaeota archaeon]